MNWRDRLWAALLFVLVVVLSVVVGISITDVLSSLVRLIERVLR